MQLRILSIALLLLISISESKAKKKKKIIHCSELSHQYKTYQEAYTIITKSQFEFHQKKLLTLSSLLSKLEFFSCNKKSGYLLIEYDNNIAMLHQNVPINIWQNLFLEDDPLDYYETNIKHNKKYKLQIVSTKK